MATVASPSSRKQTPSFSRSFSYPFASYTSSNFSSGGASLLLPATPRPTSSSLRFSSEQRSMAITKNRRKTAAVSTSNHRRRTCMCSPTTHPGSFRCSYHKRLAEQHKTASFHCTSSLSGNTLNLRRSAMQNSLVRIGGVEGEMVKRALMSALIRPSSHNRRRREAFHPRPSRLSVVSKAEDS